MHTLAFDEDMHVHSTFSDGKNTLEENIAQAERRGLKRLGCVDHVRADTEWVPNYVHTVREHAKLTTVQLFVGIEAKILDGTGKLDIPSNTDGVDFIYAADHQFPYLGRCYPPREIKAMLHANQITEDEVIDALTTSTMCAMKRYSRIVLAHLFSVLPKVGVDESRIPEEYLWAQAKCAKETDTSIEVDERWKCPSFQTLRYFQKAGVRIWMSSDSHRSDTIGLYQYNRDVAARLEAP